MIKIRTFLNHCLSQRPAFENDLGETLDTINVYDAPAAIGPYCHAMRTGNLVFCSCQTLLDPDTMKLVGTTIEEQTKRVLDNLSIVLVGTGLSL